MKKLLLVIVSLIFLISLTACDLGKNDVIKGIKYDLSTEYRVPISDVNIETIDYGISVFTTNQFKATIKSKGISFYLIAKNGEGDNFRRIPIKK